MHFCYLILPWSITRNVASPEPQSSLDQSDSKAQTFIAYVGPVQRTTLSAHTSPAFCICMCHGSSLCFHVDSYLDDFVVTYVSRDWNVKSCVRVMSWTHDTWVLKLRHAVVGRRTRLSVLGVNVIWVFRHLISNSSLVPLQATLDQVWLVLCESVLQKSQRVHILDVESTESLLSSRRGPLGLCDADTTQTLQLRVSRLETYYSPIHLPPLPTCSLRCKWWYREQRSRRGQGKGRHDD